MIKPGVYRAARMARESSGIFKVAATTAGGAGVVGRACRHVHLFCQFDLPSERVEKKDFSDSEGRKAEVSVVIYWRAREFPGAIRAWDRRRLPRTN